MPSTATGGNGGGRRGNGAADDAARDAMRCLLAGETPGDIGIVAEMCGSWSPIVAELLRAHGVGGMDAVRKAFGAAVKADPGLAQLVAGDAEPVRNYTTLTDVRTAFGAVSWAWQHWIPNAQLSLICGEQGIGKSFLAASFVAAFTGAGTFPDRTAAPRTGSVLLVETESMRSAWLQRLEVLGVGDEAVIMPAPKGDPHYVCDLPADAPLLTALAQDHNVAAILVDSLSGGHALDENNADVRAVLQVLGGLASTVAVPVLVVHHLRKRSGFETAAVTLDRVRGSSTITQFARSVIALSRPDPEQKIVRVEVIKASLCEPPQPFGARFNGEGVHFEDAPETPHTPTVTERGIEFLRIELRKEPQAYAELLAKAETQGISKNSLYRAKTTLWVVSVKGMWSLPVESPWE